MEEDILTVPTTGKVYNTTAFTIATVLGGPLAAAYMAASNFHAFGEPQKARYSWVVGALLLIAATTTALFPIFDHFPAFFYTLLLLFVVILLVRRFQGRKLQQHLSDGGTVYPTGRAVVIGLIFMIMLLVVIFGGLYLLQQLEDAS